jgi:hypothetical protein
MSSIRTWHTYLGILIAPSVLFFALTGAVQLFSLHESHGTYVPPLLVEKLSSVHKDQVFAQKEHDDHDHPEPGTANDAHHPQPADDHDEAPSVGTYLLKWYFLLVSLALTVSTLLGLWMGLTQIRRKRTGWWLLGVGFVVPVVLCFF